MKKAPAKKAPAKKRASVEVSTGNLGDADLSVDYFYKGIKSALTDYGSINYYSSGEGRMNNSGTGTNKLNLIGKLIKDIVPKDKRGCLRKAYDFYDTDDYLQPLVETMVDFGSAGFNLLPQPVEDTIEAYKNINKYSLLIADFSRTMKFDQVVDQLFRDYFISDSCILYWKVKVGRTRASKSESKLFPELIDINALNPSLVNWCNTGGVDIMEVFIHDAARKQIAQEIEALARIGVTNRQQVIDQLQKTGTGQKWTEAVLDKKDFVSLSSEDGDNWLVETKERKYNGLCYPTMKNIFVKLTIRAFHQEGELSAAFLFAFFIMLIKQGESISTGNQAGSRKNWITPTEAKKLQDNFTNFSKALRMVMNHTTSVDWVFPPKEMFDPSRLDGANKAILNWAGISESIFSGGGNENYSGGYLGIRKTTARIGKARRRIGSTLSSFFHHPTIAGQTEILRRIGIQPVFDENILKEPKQLLDEIKFLFENEINDQRTALRELGRNPEAVKSSTLQSAEEQKNLKVWTGVGGQKNAKGKNKNPGGRPANPGASSDEYTRLQTPAPS